MQKKNTIRHLGALKRDSSFTALSSCFSSGLDENSSRDLGLVSGPRPCRPPRACLVPDLPGVHFIFLPMQIPLKQRPEGPSGNLLTSLFISFQAGMLQGLSAPRSPAGSRSGPTHGKPCRSAPARGVQFRDVLLHVELPSFSSETGTGRRPYLNCEWSASRALSVAER